MAESSHSYSAAWRQFLIARKAILAEYDQAVAHSKEQLVSTHHGMVGEAAVRDWLATFLPKRYGVAPGYIKSQGFESAHQSAHFDVIVYDQLEAPTLWIEANKDKSDGGRARIVPAEHVRAILEVKAAFNRRTVREAVAKLSELKPLMSGVDAPSERYPRFLPTSVVLAMFFFELRLANRADIEPLNLIRNLELQREFYGAVVLRGEGRPVDNTGLVRRLQSDTPFEETLLEHGLLHGHVMASTAESNGRHLSSMLTWTDIHFSDFAFDLLALLNGTYQSGFSSSLHGLDFRKRV